MDFRQRKTENDNYLIHTEVTVQKCLVEGGGGGGMSILLSRFSI